MIPFIYVDDCQQAACINSASLSQMHMPHDTSNKLFSGGKVAVNCGVLLRCEDLLQCCAVLCRIFEMMLDYDLLLAHPSVCSERESLSHIMALLKCQPHNVLRYTTAVDVIAPAFDINFFLDSVILTLDNATYGEQVMTASNQSVAFLVLGANRLTDCID